MRWARDLVGGWAVYSGDVGDEVGTRSHTCHGGWGVGTWGNCYYVYLS